MEGKHRVSRLWSVSSCSFVFVSSPPLNPFPFAHTVLFPWKPASLFSSNHKSQGARVHQVNPQDPTQHSPPGLCQSQLPSALSEDTCLVGKRHLHSKSGCRNDFIDHQVARVLGKCVPFWSTLSSAFDPVLWRTQRTFGCNVSTQLFWPSSSNRSYCGNSPLS